MPKEAPVQPLSGQMSREAFSALESWTGAVDGIREKRRAAIRDLPLLIRRHGLRRTLHHWLGEKNDDQQHQTVARSFVEAMASISSGLPLLTAVANNAQHALQTRLALTLADQWLALAEPMPAEQGNGGGGGGNGAQPQAPLPLPPNPKPSERNAAFELFNAPYPDIGLPNEPRAWEVNSEATAIHFDRVCACEIASDGPYALAFKRWKAICQAPNTTYREFALTHRMLIGLSEPSLWETSISIDPVYGVPAISGTAIKGLAVHFADEHLRGEGDAMSEPIRDALLGKPECMGEVDFLDAWWVPGSGPQSWDERFSFTQRPFVREVVTPHHPKFLNRESADMATPFDSPVPVPQLAAHGSFLFAVKGPKVWAEHALDIVQLALEMAGIGARTPEYGQAQLRTA